MKSITRNGVPIFDFDPFSDFFLLDPYPFYEEMRDAGPIVRLSRYDVYAMARHRDVSGALVDWKTLRLRPS